MLEALENHIDRFTHELRTSLSLILSPTEQILKQTKLDESYTRIQARLIKNNSMKFLLLLDQLLDVSKLACKKMATAMYRGDLTDFIASIAENFKDTTRERCIRLNLDSQLPVADYLFDRDQLDKAIFNILSHAVRFTPEGGEIRIALVSFENPEGMAGTRIMVQSTGLGLSPGELPNSPDTPSLISAAENPETGWLITKALVELMGGTMEVTNEIGMVTKVTLLLPLQPLERSTRETQDAQKVLPPAFHEPKAEVSSSIDRSSDLPIIQVIASHTDLRLFLHVELSAKYQVLTALDGEEGITQALQHTPDLIICDVSLPWENGFEVCNTLKQHPPTNHIPIILLTDQMALKSRLKGLKKGADAYLTKPFSVEELTLRAQQLIAIRKLLKEKYKRGNTQRATPPKVHPPDRNPNQQLIDQLHTFIEKELDNDELDVEALAQEAGMSHSQLYRKVKAITSLSLAGFIREYRLLRAMEFLKEGQHNVTEVAYRTGFSNRRYFHKVFVKKYGYAPSEIRTGTCKKTMTQT